MSNGSSGFVTVPGLAFHAYQVYTGGLDQLTLMLVQPCSVSQAVISGALYIIPFTIPPGQFAFLLTEEVVSVPPDALAFISIRAKTKFRGLVNVSGFHVDPGYQWSDPVPVGT